MRTILAKVKGASPDLGQRQSQSTEAKMNLGGFSYSAPPVPTMPNQSSDFSSQSASSPWQSDSVSLPQHTPQQNIDFAAAPSYPVVDTIMNAPLDLNWNLWDNQFQAPLELKDNLPELWDYDSGNTFTFQDANGPFNGSWGPAGI
ncbi:hypothetical protein B0O99DRAFT_169642 [Bisporella sp. PMI_857]|nr:hypothetical protein B0O99DRAFT_169642 [Bisporella sp. PMI_857]